MYEQCGRPFSSLNNMNQTMIRNYKATVDPHDTVILLGDFCYRSHRPATSYLNEMKTGARVFFCRGNHDQWLDELTPEEKREHFYMIIEDRCVLERNGWRIGLSHIPTPKEDFPVPVHVCVCSHIHNNRAGYHYETFMSIPDALNAGVDINGFTPVTLRQLAANNERFYGRKYDIPEELFRAFE